MYDIRIRKIMVSSKVQEKIFKRHNVKREHIEAVFFDEPYYYKSKQDMYVAIGFVGDYVTVVFDCRKGNAEIVTAYYSSKWQRKLYRVKRWKK